MKRVVILAMVAMLSMPMVLLADGNESKEAKKECEEEAAEKKIVGDEKMEFLAICIREHLIQEATQPKSEEHKEREKDKDMKE